MPPGSYYLPQRRLVSQDDAAITQRPDVPRSKFTGRWNRLTTFDAGKLYPILVEEVLPGDHLVYDVTAYIRMQTPLFPIFSNQRVDTHFFFVPNRLVWENWTKFMGEQINPTSSIDYTIPICDPSNAALLVGSIWDHMGIPIGMITGAEKYEINALPFRAYNLIWNDWFRDQNLNSSENVNKGNGPDNNNHYFIMPRAKFHDYFTSALPWPQKFTAPTVPIGGLAPVLGIGTTSASWAVGPSAAMRETDGGTPTYALYQDIATYGASLAIEGQGSSSDGYPAIYADLAQATGVAINTFRQAFLIQQLLERDARGGTRYTELIRAHFGVINPDFRLQRPEYIGGGSSPLTVTPIAQTAPDTGTPVGALGAAATSVGQHKASYAATEHGYIIGLISVRTELAYQQGIPRHYSRRTRYDYYWPSLAGLGEQAILRKEIYATGVDADDAIVFGYQERWHEYRQRQSEVTGYMRSTVSGTLDAWHLAEEFLTPPTLNWEFIEDDPPMDRVLAAGDTTDDMQYLADILFQRTAVRPLPTFGTPVTLGRF